MEEPLVSLVKTCQILNECSTSQLTAYMSALPNIFEKHNQRGLLLRIFREGLRRCYKHLNEPLFQDMQAVLPSPQHEDQPSEPTSTLLAMPKALQMFCFNFLSENDLYKAQRTCRNLFFAARDPNAMYHLEMPHASHIASVYRTKPLFSRIRSLRITNMSRYTVQTINAKWSSTLLSFSCSGSECPKSFPALPNLHKCSLQRALVKMLATPRVHCATLRVLDLADWRLDHPTLKALSECVSLETLSLRGMEMHPVAVADFISEFSFSSKPMFLEKLTRFQVDVRLMTFGTFVNFMLANGARKTLEIKSNGNHRPEREHWGNDLSSVFSMHAPHGVSALLNVDNLTVCRTLANDRSWTDAKALTSQLSTSLKKFNKSRFGSKCKRFRSFSVTMTPESFDESKVHKQKNLMRDMLSIVSFSRHSSLRLNLCDNTQTAYLKWFQDVCTLIETPNRKMFDEIDIDCVGGCGIIQGIAHLLRYECEWETECQSKYYAEEFMEQFDLLFSPWLSMDEEAMRKVGLRSLRISYRTLAEYRTLNDLDDFDLDERLDEEQASEAYELELERQQSVVDAGWQAIALPVIRATITDILPERCCLVEAGEHIKVSFAVTSSIN